jgi:FKBP-type peptidyl-prolyl cis-trans isomerase
MSKGEVARLPKLEIKRRKTPAPKKLMVRDLRRGTGAPVRPRGAILVDFFDVKYGSAQHKNWSGRFGPTKFGYTGTIKGWQVGLRGMRVGGRRELIVPPSLGYEGKTIVYVIDLLAVYPG